jgi:hypothetical protein
MNILSVVIGTIAFILAVVGLFPLIGWLNWLVIIVALIGAFIGLFAQKRTGLNLNLFVLVIAVIRLFIGGGII